MTVPNGEKQKTKEHPKSVKYMRFVFGSGLSAPLILCAVILSVVNVELAVNLPGSTAELFGGEFTGKAIGGLLLNYASALVLAVTVHLVKVFAVAKSIRNVRHTVWKKMLSADTEFYRENPPQFIHSAVTDDAVYAVETFVSFVTLFPAGIYFLIRSFIEVSEYGEKLLPALLLLLPFYAVFTFIIGKFNIGITRKIQQKIGNLTLFLAERITDFRFIKSTASEEHEEKEGIAAIKELYRARVKLVYAESAVSGFNTLAESVSVLIAVLWGAALLKDGMITFEAWVEFFLLVPEINVYFGSLCKSIAELCASFGYAARIGEILQSDKNEDIIKDKITDKLNDGNIVFDDVSYSYAEKTGLDGFSAVFERGRHTAIVGKSGSGKTTVFRILERFDNPRKGTVTIGGTNITNTDVKEYRGLFSYVVENPILLGDTIRKAITYGVKREITDEEIFDALNFVRAYDFVNSLENGIDTAVSNGAAFSAGIIRKLSIAREILKNTDILLLDEFTSHLDGETSSEIEKTVIEKYKGKTVIYATNDMDFASRADMIIVMNAGKAEAFGTHDELIEKSAAYREMFHEYEIGVRK